MKYPHIVVRDGKWYNAGEDVPVENTPVSPDFMNPPGKAYTKTEIMRMSTADLQALATEQGINNAEEITGAELKKLLIEKLGL